MTIKASNFPTTRPTLDLNFAATKRLDPRVTFSRASAGTYVDGNGVLQSAATNVPRFDHNPTTGESLGLLVEEARTNDVKYSSYPSLWSNNLGVTVRPKAGLAPDGTFSAERATQDTATSNHVLRQYGATPNSNTYRISCFLKYSGHRYVAILCSINAGLYGCFDLVDGAASVGSITNIGNGWFYCQSINYTGSSINTLSICLTTNFGSFYNNHGSSSGPVYTGDGVSSVLIWGVQAEVGGFATSHIPTPATFTGRASTATYYDANGIIQTAGSGVARSNAYFPDENGVFRSAGLLLEAAGTNLCFRSQEFGNAYFDTSSGSTVVDDSIAAPDGTLTADLLREDNSTGTHQRLRYFNYSMAAGQYYTSSAFVKPAGRTAVTFEYRDGIHTIFDLQTLTVSGGGSGNAIRVAASITPLPNGWYRLTATSLGIGGYNSGFGIGLYSGGSRSYTGDGVSGVYVWGLQVENNPYPTSYIPTTTSTVTRAADTSTSATVTRSADVAQITGSNFSSWYRQDEGTMFAQARLNFSLSTFSVFPPIYQIGDYPNRLWTLHLNGGINQLKIGADVHSRNLQTLASSPQSFKVAQALSNTSLTYSASKDGATTLTGSLSNAITGLTKLYIGGPNPGATKHIARLTYYPVRLPDATLQTITL